MRAATVLIRGASLHCRLVKRDARLSEGIEPGQKGLIVGPMVRHGECAGRKGGDIDGFKPGQPHPGQVVGLLPISDGMLR